MSENVVSLVDRRAEIDPDLLRSAEALLDLVRSGRADGLVWAAALRDGHAGQTSSAGKDQSHPARDALHPPGQDARPGVGGVQAGRLRNARLTLDVAAARPELARHEVFHPVRPAGHRPRLRGPGPARLARRSRRPVGDRQGARLRRLPGAGAGHAGGGEDDRLPGRSLPRAEALARRPRRRLDPARPAGPHPPGRAGQAVRWTARPAHAP